jgi:hypothetical protein
MEGFLLGERDMKSVIASEAKQSIEPQARREWIALSLRSSQ